MPDWPTTLLSILSVLTVTAIGALTWQSNRRSSDRAQVVERDKRNDYLERRDRIRDDYVIVLRGIISDADLDVPPYPPDPPS